MAITANQAFNFIQGSDITGESSYDIWKKIYGGTEAEFAEFLRSGPKGDDAHIYAIAVSDTVIKKDAKNVLTPSSVTFNGYYRIGTAATRYDYSGRFMIEESTNGINWETKYTSVEDEASVTYVPSSTDVAMIKCHLYTAGDTTDELDVQNVAILSDVANLEVGARNLLSNSDIRYELTKESSEVIDSISIVNNFDLQRLINKAIALSFYADTPGSYTNSDDGSTSTSNKFEMIAKLVWSDSLGLMESKLTETPLKLEAIGINKMRVSTIYDVVAPEGYDTIDNLTFDIVLTLKPDDTNDSTWVFERPKLEIGTLSTQWTLAPEDVGNNIEKTTQDILNLETKYTELETEVSNIKEEVNNNIETAVSNLETEVSNIKENITQVVQDSKDYTDTTVANLVNSAPETLDTLGELATAFTENKEVVDALDEAITKKQDKDKLTTSLSSESTDVQYPSAKAVFDFVNNKPGLKVENGGEIFNDYTNNAASATYSHSEGRLTKAVGRGSHAEGDSTIAGDGNSSLSTSVSELDTYQSQVPGAASHTEGIGTLAKKAASHAEGYKTISEGNASHAEGENTVASGKGSHAEGGACQATGDYSHAEGCNDQDNHKVLASGRAAHAEGAGTTASGDGSHAEGNSTVASGAYAHAEGYETQATNGNTHAEGFKTVAAGLRSHAEGNASQTGTDATAAHAEGWGAQALGVGSHAEGVQTIAKGNYSHAEGGDTIATATYQHVEGKYNIEDTEKKYAHIVGNGSSTERSNAHTVDWDGNAEYAGDVIANGCGGANPVSLIELSERVSNIGSNPQATNGDWNQNDETAPDYIKNRTHYTYNGGEVVDEVIFENENVDFDHYNGLASYSFPSPLPIVEGEKYLVQFNAKSIILTCGTNYLENVGNNDIGSSVTLNSTNISITYFEFGDTLHLKISTIKDTEVVVPLEDKFIPDTILRFEVEEILEIPDVEMTVTDDGNGNVTMVTSGIDIIDDGNGNITITSEHMTVTDDGNGNVTITV